MKNYFIFVIVGWCSLACAQDTTGRWSLGLVGGIEQCGRMLRHVNDDNMAIEQWNGLEKNVWRITGGLRAEWKLTQHWSLLTGLSYADRGYRIDTLTEASLNDLDYHFRFVELPVGVVYNSKSFGRNSLLASAQITLGYSLNNVLYYRKDGQSAIFEMPAFQGVNPFQSNVSAALGVRRAINERANADIYFSGNQSLLPIADGPLERRMYAVGFFIAVTNRF